jgi:hypothetical protein
LIKDLTFLFSIERLLRIVSMKAVKCELGFGRVFTVRIAQSLRRGQTSPAESAPQ